MLFTAFVELLGVGSILPFLSMAMDPDIVQRNQILHTLYVGLGFRTFENFLVFFGMAILVLFVVMNVVSAFATFAQIRFAYHVGHSISCRLMDAYLSKPYSYFLSHNTAELGENILAETANFVAGVLKPGGVLISRTITVAVVLVLLVILEPVVVLLTMVTLGGSYGVIYALIRGRLLRIGEKSLAANQARFKTTAEAFGGFKDIKTLGREAYFLQQYRAASSKYADCQVSKGMCQEGPRYVIHTLAFCGFMAAFVILIASGRTPAEVVPLMGFFAFAALRLLPGFQEILLSLGQFRFFRHLLFKFYADLVQDVPVRGPQASAAGMNVSFNTALKLNGVRFRYPDTTKDVIKGVSLEVPKNSSIAVVGVTGCGKTTLVDIIMGLLSPHDGTVTVDDQQINPENVIAWRKLIGYVPQDVFLSDDTVARNIAYAINDAEIDGAAVETAARIAHIHEFITNELPEAYETVIGERGVRLSGGQRQRLGIARALYHDPQVLVLDEATSDIDNVTEAHITEAIQSLAGTKTIVVVAHRLATIRRCDRIVLIEDGRIVASGTYDELLTTSVGFRGLTHPATAAAAGKS
jgi:ABC-type bacteriocin/lantibiotic exporter with double-glycine peptidase domain